MAWSALFASRAASMVYGMVAGGLLSQSPGVQKGIRTIVRGTIKTGLRLSRDARTVFERIREDLADMTAEVQAELDAESGTDGAENGEHACGHDHGHSHGEGKKG